KQKKTNELNDQKKMNEFLLNEAVKKGLIKKRSEEALRKRINSARMNVQKRIETNLMSSIALGNEITLGNVIKSKQTQQEEILNEIEQIEKMEKQIKRPKFELQEKALTGYTSTWKLNPDKKETSDYEIYYNKEFVDDVAKIITQEFFKLGGCKVRIAAYPEFRKPGSVFDPTIWTNPQIVTNESETKKVTKNFASEIIKRIEEFEGMGSGWIYSFTNR